MKKQVTKGVFIRCIQSHLTGIGYDAYIDDTQFNSILNYINYIKTGEKKHKFSRSKDETIYGLYININGNEVFKGVFKDKEKAEIKAQTYKKDGKVFIYSIKPIKLKI